jgi:hypothetical protein
MKLKGKCQGEKLISKWKEPEIFHENKKNMQETEEEELKDYRHER